MDLEVMTMKNWSITTTILGKILSLCKGCSSYFLSPTNRMISHSYSNVSLIFKKVLIFSVIGQPSLLLNLIQGNSIPILTSSWVFPFLTKILYKTRRIYPQIYCKFEAHTISNTLNIISNLIKEYLHSNCLPGCIKAAQLVFKIQNGWIHLRQTL